MSVSIPAAFAVVGAFYVVNRRVIQRLLRVGRDLRDESAAEGFVDQCLAWLRRPLPPRAAEQLVNRLVEMPLNDQMLIKKLKSFADKDEFLFDQEILLRAIDRTDLRRRQRLFEGNTLAS